MRASDRVVLSLIDEYLDEKRALVVDNYYTNAVIATKLLHKNSSGWNAKKISKDIPKKVLKPSSPLKTKDVCQERDGIVARCWKDKKS